MEMKICNKRIGHEKSSHSIRNDERKTGDCKSFTNHPGGNLVDGLPPASIMIFMQEIFSDIKVARADRNTRRAV